MLLRFFMNMYDMEVVEEESFLKWKEEVNDQYPGKGKALFQVLLFHPLSIRVDRHKYSILFSNNVDFGILLGNCKEMV